MERLLAFISILIALLCPNAAKAQTVCYPDSDGAQTECKINIEAEKGYISGICVLIHEGDSINGAIVNEFGLTALNFYYSTKEDKVKLENVASMLDKWYIRPVLSNDIRELLHALKEGKTEYKDEKYHISYLLSPMDTEDDGNNDDDEQPTE